MKATNPVVAQQFLVECREDYVGLWSVIRRIRAVGISERPKVIETTLDLLAQLLSEGKIVAGQFANDEFHEWKLPTQHIIEKIEREWIELGRDPTIGEIAWFTTIKSAPPTRRFAP
jgi:hypothetical protein